jgi:hypothetical protein
MANFRFLRYILSVGAAALLAGCGGSQPVAGPGVTLQSSQRVVRRTSEALLYASNSSRIVKIYSYPSGTSIGKLTGFSDSFIPRGLCTDKAGDVFVTGIGGTYDSNPAGEIYEFAHGDTTPIAELSDDYPPVGCAVDPSTGNLAVSSSVSKTIFHGSIAVFANASGMPTYYINSIDAGFTWCAYDDNGNLFVSQGSDVTGHANWIAELAKGTQSFRKVKLSNGGHAGSLQLYRGKLAVASPLSCGNGNAVYLVKVANGVAKVVATTSIKGGAGQPSHGQFWIDGAYIAGYVRHSLLIWNYPAGGTPEKVVDAGNFRLSWYGVAVSH